VCLVVDEAHFVGDSARGAVLEVQNAATGGSGCCGQRRTHARTHALARTRASGATVSRRGNKQVEGGGGAGAVHPNLGDALEPAHL
jgi:hypothetical protein